MSSEQPQILASGTPITQGTLPEVSGPNALPNPQTDFISKTNEHEDDEQALESHEVIELQTFSDRKHWIEEKIKVRSIVPRAFSTLLIHHTVSGEDAAYRGFCRA